MDQHDILYYILNLVALQPPNLVKAKLFCDFFVFLHPFLHAVFSIIEDSALRQQIDGFRRLGFGGVYGRPCAAASSFARTSFTLVRSVSKS